LSDSKKLRAAVLGFFLSCYWASGVCVAGATPVGEKTGKQTGISRDYVTGVLNEAVNTNTLIASQDLISNGRFVQRNRGQPDTKYETFRLPAEAVFGEKTDVVRPFVRGSFGLLRVTSGVAPLDGVGDNDFSVSRLFALTSGGGVYIRLAEGLSIAPAFLVTYTHLRNSYNFNNPFSQRVLEGEYGEFYNWNLDLLTYIPALRMVYEHELATGKFRYIVSVSQLLNDSIHSTSRATKIDSASGLVANRVEFRQDLGLSVGNAALAVQPFFQWSNISGKAASGLNFVNLFEVGADLISLLREPLWLFSEVYIGASYVSADNFEGYHIGIGGHF
jgi:hypothetical protein